jgi:hypothetical protein
VRTLNGYRADELVNAPGLLSRQRLVVPLWVSALGIAFRGLGRVVVWAGRRPLLTVPVVTVGLMWLVWGWLGLAGLAGLVLAPLAVLRVRAPEVFASRVVGPAVGQWRLLVTYRRLWRAGMIGAGLATRHAGVDYLPQITSAVSTGNVDELNVRLLYGQTPEDFADACEKLRHTFGVHRVAVVETRSGRVTVRFFRQDPLTAVVPALPVPQSLDLAGLPVARMEDGGTYSLGLLGTHVLIAGASGAGKGSVLWSIIRALSPGITSGHVHLVGVDPKRMELVFARGLFAELQDRDPASMVDLLERLVTQMQNRADRLSGKTRQHTPSATDPAVVLVIDELASLTAYLPDRDLRNRVKAALSMLLSQGRAVGFYVIAALQDPRKEVIAFRDLFPTRILLRVTEPEHVDMVFGDGARDRGAVADQIPLSLPGVGYVLLEAVPAPVRVRFGHVTDTDLGELVATTTKTPETVIDLRDHATSERTA